MGQDDGQKRALPMRLQMSGICQFYICRPEMPRICYLEYGPPKTPPISCPARFRLLPPPAPVDRSA